MKCCFFSSLFTLVFEIKNQPVMISYMICAGSIKLHVQDRSKSNVFKSRTEYVICQLYITIVKKMVRLIRPHQTKLGIPSNARKGCTKSIHQRVKTLEKMDNEAEKGR